MVLGSLVRGRLSRTLLPSKQVCGSSDLGQTSLGPRLDPALSSPHRAGGVCAVPERFLKDVGESWGFPSYSHKRTSQNGASTCPSFSLGLQEQEPGWLGLALQTPGAGSLGVWLSGPSSVSLLGLGAPGSVARRDPGSLGLPDPGASLSLCLLSSGSLSESLCLLPSVSTFSVLTEVGKWRQRCQPPWPPKKPLPHCFLQALEWSGRGQRRGCSIGFAQGWRLWGGLSPCPCSVDTSHPDPQLPAPPSSVWTPPWFSRSSDLSGEGGWGRT